MSTAKMNPEKNFLVYISYVKTAFCIWSSTTRALTYDYVKAREMQTRSADKNYNPAVSIPCPLRSRRGYVEAGSLKAATSATLRMTAVEARAKSANPGSSSFITDATGYAVQHLQYLPFGETFVDQQNGYDARYTFSAKEKDDETQYSYFGARYYDSDLSVWLSVDPLAGKYPSTSPYMYCLGMPTILIDPNGMDTAFLDNIVRTDFLAAQKTVNDKVTGIQTELKDPDLSSKKTKKLEGQLAQWQKLKDDFDYICSESSPLTTYSSDMSAFSLETKGHTESTYNEKTGEILSSKVFIREGWTSSVIHENRHTRQSPFMAKCAREIEAFTYQSVFSPADVQKSIDNARSNKYPPGGAIDPALMPEWGIKEMVEFVYGCK